ncbi:hypothetical protein, partial [Oceanispirochaeta sp.]|uniref:hypothetical protein n=1 Tax=Oceanispirochaeta sp. TaxID=2035350 RepID=UPI00262DAA90
MPLSKNKIDCGFLLLILFLISYCASTQTYQYQYVEANEYLARRDFAGASAVIEGYKEETYK